MCLCACVCPSTSGFLPFQCFFSLQPEDCVMTPNKLVLFDHLCVCLFPQTLFSSPSLNCCTVNVNQLLSTLNLSQYWLTCTVTSDLTSSHRKPHTVCACVHRWANASDTPRLLLHFCYFMGKEWFLQLLISL